MINKQKNTEKAMTAREIARKYDLTELEKEFDEFIVNNKNYRAHVLMIGGYSAGKSALLNKYIGKYVLTENQGPETDIAAELYFSEQEHIAAIYTDGSYKEIASAEDVDTENVKHLEYYIDSENIKTQCDYVMVDTPGFDSGIEKHNKALMQYIDHGTVFFLVIDCDKGTISESTLRFLGEVLNYSADIAVIINKCDKKTSEEVQNIKEHIEELLLSVTGRTFPVICTSVFDDNAGEKLKNLVGSFEPKYLYDKNITSALEKKQGALIDALELIKASAVCDTAEIEEEISRREMARNEILDRIERQKKKMSAKLHNEVRERIISNVRTQLICSSEMLAKAYMCSVDMFRERVVEITRPILISEIEEYSSEVYKDIIDNLNYNSVGQSGDTDKLVPVMDNVYNKLKNLNEDGFMFPTLHYRKEKGDNDNSNKVYKTISSVFAVATDIITPAVELLIIFLPEIISLLNIISGNTPERKLINAMRNDVIPQIMSKLQVEIDKSLSNVENVMAEKISAEVKGQLECESDALSNALNEKKAKENQFEEYIKNIDHDIEIIRK